MAVITISRQLGSLGTTLGRQVAGRLEFRLVHRELINQAASLAGAPDMALATIDELGLLGIEPDEAQQRAYLESVQTIIQDLAAEGNVIIVGRAGQAILQTTMILCIGLLPFALGSFLTIWMLGTYLVVTLLLAVLADLLLLPAMIKVGIIK